MVSAMINATRAYSATKIIACWGLAKLIITRNTAPIEISPMGLPHCRYIKMRGTGVKIPTNIPSAGNNNATPRMARNRTNGKRRAPSRSGKANTLR